MDSWIILALSFVIASYLVNVGVAISLLVVNIFCLYWIKKSTKTNQENPFKIDSRIPRKAYIHDQKQRDEVIKQSFKIDRVPKDLDAIVIGSGIGGLTTAAIMAKAGKKVLVLEQHDQAGGCCHTYIDKGYEFDVGIHYIGELESGCVNRTLVDQISDGQIEWDKLDDEYDVVVIGDGSSRKFYPVMTGEENWKKFLKEKFPSETRAIDEFFKLLKTTSSFDFIMGALKLLPLKLSMLGIRLGLVHFFTSFWRGPFRKTSLEIISGLTNNLELRTLMCYSFGDFGSPPAESHFIIHALVHNHFLQYGGFYPKGGASEIALNIIPVIERAGGKVLVKANVQRILYNGGKVTGVKVKKGNDVFDVSAPMIISNAGIYNTFQRLLPIEAARGSYYTSMINNMKPGTAALNLFIGLDASNEDLGLEAKNYWYFCKETSAFEVQNYYDLSAEEVKDAQPPFLFVSFPSAKDSEWNNKPGRQSKSTCAVVILSNWEWFNQWEDKQLKKRGDDYEDLKKAIGHQMLEQVMKIFPKLEGHVDYLEIGTPVTNKHYLAQPHGEIYGLDHNYQRFTPEAIAKLRPKTDIKGLFLTGQDIFACGFTGALFGGVMCASETLGRNIMDDLEKLHAKMKK